MPNFLATGLSRAGEKTRVKVFLILIGLYNVIYLGNFLANIVCI